MDFKVFNPAALDISAYGFGSFPFEGEAEAVLDSAAARRHDFRPGGMARGAYLDAMEPAVREAAGWLDARGALIDPALGYEWRQATPRFAAAAAVLLRFGRAPELMEPALRAMSHSCAKLADRDAVKGESPDFWMRDLAVAYECFKGVAPDGLLARWRRDLSSVRAEDTNVYADKTPGRPGVAAMHNWVVFGMSGESLRESVGIGGGADFLWGHRWIDEYLPHQLHYFTDYGMYRDPGDPITYDITTRLQLSAALAFGYGGALAGALGEILRRGALTMLRFVSPEGFAPFGGRSALFNFQEAVIAALCEMEASRYKRADARLAGAFKRQARLCAAAIRPWFCDEKPFRHIKNRFPPATRHGCDAYGQYSVYSMLCASLLGLAALFADDEIAEAPAPAEIGGFTLALAPAFHKKIVNAHGVYIESDTAADPKHDATGVGRILFRGLPFALPLAAPFAHAPACAFAAGARPPPSPVALCAPDEPGLEPEIKVSDGGASVSFRWESAASGALRVSVPILVHDGARRAAHDFTGGGLRVCFDGCAVSYRWPGAASAEFLPDEYASRAAVHRTLMLTARGGSLTLEMTASQCSSTS